MAQNYKNKSLPEWSGLPSELLQEVAKKLLPSQLWAFASVCKSWREATLPMVSTLHAPLASDVTLPCGPPGSLRLEVITKYYASLQQKEHVNCNSDATNHLTDAISAPSGSNPSSSTRALSSSQPCPPSSASFPGISPPLLLRLLHRFPYARTLGLHRASLQHPFLENAALRCLTSCTATPSATTTTAAMPSAGLTSLQLYDTLGWDFPQDLSGLGRLKGLVCLKLWGLGAPGLDSSAQWAFSRGLMSLVGLTRLQELTLRWLFGRQEVVWTCAQTPIMLAALAVGGTRLRLLDLNAFLLDKYAAAVLSKLKDLRSLTLYFDAAGAGWEEVTSLMALPELTRLILSYEGDAMTGPWVGEGPPLVDEPLGPPPPPPPGPAAAPPPDGGGGGGGDPHADYHNHHHALLPYQADQHLDPQVHSNYPYANHHNHLNPQPSNRNHHHLTTNRNGSASSSGSLPPSTALSALSGSSSGGGPGPSSPAPPPPPLLRRRLPSWAPRPYSLQYLSLTTSPSLHRLLGRLDVLLPYLTYLSLSSVGDFGAGQRELEAGLMAMAQSGSRLARIKLFCMELRPALMSALTSLPCLQELMLFNVWVSVGPQEQQGQQQGQQQQQQGQQQQGQQQGQPGPAPAEEVAAAGAGGEVGAGQPPGDQPPAVAAGAEAVVDQEPGPMDADGGAGPEADVLLPAAVPQLQGADLHDAAVPSGTPPHSLAEQRLGVAGDEAGAGVEAADAATAAGTSRSNGGSNGDSQLATGAGAGCSRYEPDATAAGAAVTASSSPPQQEGGVAQVAANGGGRHEQPEGGLPGKTGSGAVEGQEQQQEGAKGGQEEGRAGEAAAAAADLPARALDSSALGSSRVAAELAAYLCAQIETRIQQMRQSQHRGGASGSSTRETPAAAAGGSGGGSGGGSAAGAGPSHAPPPPASAPEPTELQHLSRLDPLQLEVHSQLLQRLTRVAHGMGAEEDAAGVVAAVKELLAQLVAQRVRVAADRGGGAGGAGGPAGGGGGAEEGQGAVGGAGAVPPLAGLNPAMLPPAGAAGAGDGLAAAAADGAGPIPQPGALQDGGAGPLAAEGEPGAPAVEEMGMDLDEDDEEEEEEEEEGAGGAEPSELLRNAMRATAVAQTHLESLVQLRGRLQQLLIEFGPEGSTCFITQDLVRTLEPLAPGLRSLHLLSWNMEGLMLPHSEHLSFTAFTALRSLTLANRISPDSQVQFAPPLSETSGHVIYLGELPKTLRSLCANRINIVAGMPPQPPTPAPTAPAPTTTTAASVPAPQPTQPPQPRLVSGAVAADDAAAPTGTAPSNSADPSAPTPTAPPPVPPPGPSPERCLVAPSLLHLWLADCNVRGALVECLGAAMPSLQTLVVRHVSKTEDLPPQLLSAIRGLKDLTTLGLGGFDHRHLHRLSGLSQLRHIMLDPRRVQDVELELEVWGGVGPPGDSDRSLALHEAALNLLASGLSHLRSVWLPDWAVPAHQLVQWQGQVAQVAPLAALRLVDHHYFWRLPAPVGCPEVQDRLQWWGFDAWNVL